MSVGRRQAEQASRKMLAPAVIEGSLAAIGVWSSFGPVWSLRIGCYGREIPVDHFCHRAGGGAAAITARSKISGDILTNSSVFLSFESHQAALSSL
jgi:hypothetical protein